MSWTGVAAEHEPVVSWMQREREDAWLEGWREGWREGFEEGRQETLGVLRDLLLSVLVLRFGALRPEHEQAIAAASPERLTQWARRMSLLSTADALFEAPQNDERDA